MPGWPGGPLSPLQTHLDSPGLQPLQVWGETTILTSAHRTAGQTGGRSVRLRDVILSHPARAAE